MIKNIKKIHNFQVKEFPKKFMRWALIKRLGITWNKNINFFGFLADISVLFGVVFDGWYFMFFLFVFCVAYLDKQMMMFLPISLNSLGLMVLYFKPTT